MKKWLIITLIASVMAGCFLEDKQINIQDVSKPTSWTYRLIPTILFERLFCVLIDGELDAMAALEMQHRLMGPPYKEGTITSTYMKLPKGKFKLYINLDYSGKEQFIYHPFSVKKGWIKVQVKSDVWWDIKDSTRAYISTVPGYGGTKVMPDSEL